MSTKWFRAGYCLPTTSGKYLICLKGVYYFAHYDPSTALFKVEHSNGDTRMLSNEPDLYWVPLSTSDSPSVFVVDDDPDDLNHIVSTVKDINPAIPVDIAQSGTQAINYLSLDIPGRAYPKIVLLDLYMPDADGFKVLQTVRTNPELQKTKVYVLSSSFSKDDWDRALQMGATAVIHKTNARIELARILTNNEIADYQ